MNDESKLDRLFESYRAACPEVEPGANFMPQVWSLIERRHGFGFAFKNMARTAVTACAALCLLLLFLNFASPFRERLAESPNYTDVLMAEHSAENTDFTEDIRVVPPAEEAPANSR